MKIVPRRILVTGGAGFLGSHLCDRLVAEGHDVLCLDNYFTGSKRNIAHLIGRPNFELLRHDVRDPIHVEVDEIYNLACPASPVHYQHDPIRTIETSVLGMINMLRLANEVGATLLQASTSEVYGDPEVHPQPETYWGHVNPIGTRSCYDEGKRCAETLCFDHHRQNDTRIKVARIFNTYGPRLSDGDGRVISNFVVSALRGEPMTVYGNGTQTRSFCYVDDLIEGLVLLMRSPLNVLGPINLGNPEEHSVNEIASLIVEMTGSPSKIVHRPLPSDDPHRRRPNIERAATEICWYPRIALREGLAKTISFFRDTLERMPNGSEPAQAAPGKQASQQPPPGEIVFDPGSRLPYRTLSDSVGTELKEWILESLSKNTEVLIMASRGDSKSTALAYELGNFLLASGFKLVDDGFVYLADFNPTFKGIRLRCESNGQYTILVGTII